MRKKFLSVVLAIAMVFSCIPMSFAVTDPNVSTAKEFSQDGLEGTIDMKAGSIIQTKNQSGYISPETTREYFNNKKIEYDGWQLMKIEILIKKINGLSINSIKPNVESLYKEESKIVELEDTYSYSFYFKNNGNYNFNIEYTLNGKTQNIILDYNVDNLIELPDIAMRGYFLEVIDKNNVREYITKDDIMEGRSYMQDGSIQNDAINIDGVQYMKTMEQLGFCSSSLGSNINWETLEPFTKGYYPNLHLFEFTPTIYDKTKVTVDENTPKIVAKMLSNMPNLKVFRANSSYNKKPIINDLKAFGSMNGKMTDIECKANGIESLEGLENHLGLRNISINKNKIEDLTPISSIKTAGTWNFIQNRISDLTPIKDVEVGSVIHFGYQNVFKDSILAKIDEKYYNIELPMPIDINGNETKVGFAKFLIDNGIGKNVPQEERNKVLVKYPNGNKKLYEIKEKDGKSYIQIPKSDLPASEVENNLKNTEMSFWFENDNGKDNRTKGKFNGKVTFKATLKAPEVAKYNATYSFESATEGKELPKEVTDLLPNDDKEYEEGNKITALNPNPDKVEVADGIWIFKGYVDKNGNQITEQLANKENANEKGNIHFKGNWEFNEKEKQDATVKYEFVNATPKDDTEINKILLTLPLHDKIMDEKPEDKVYDAESVGKSVKVEYPTNKDIKIIYEDKKENKKTYLEWIFDGYYVNGEKINEAINLKAGENVIEGRWECKDIDRVSYKFISDDGTVLPDSVMEKIPTPHHDGIYYDNQQIIPQKPESLNIEVDNGTWEFKGWNEEIIEHIHKDTVFVGKWHFTPKDTSGGTTPDKPEIPDKPVTPNKPILPNKPTEPDRVEGDDRIETSIEASKNLFPSGTNTVVLSNCERFTDVLTANPFAIQENASALLTYEDKLPEKTLKEIERLGAKKIYISGGYEAVSKEVVEELISKGYDVFRFDGKDRYDTARKIAIKIREKGNKEVIELASGENFPDALSMTSMAVKDKAPILLTKKDSIPKYTKQALAEWDVENVKIAGLDKAISKEVEKQIDEGFKIDKDKKDDSNVYDGAKSINRFGGKDRYETSTIIAANSCPMSKLGVYATGENFPDALIAGNYAGRKNAPVLLVKRDNLPEVVKDYTEKSDIERITVIGGVNAVSDEVFELIKEAIK